MAATPQVGSRWLLKRANVPDNIIEIAHVSGPGETFTARYVDVPGNDSEFTGTLFVSPLDTSNRLLSMVQRDPSTRYTALHVGWSDPPDPNWTGFWCDVRHRGIVGLFTMLPE